MRPRWITRLNRVFNPPKCLDCGCSTEGGLYCDLCGYKLFEATRAKALAQLGPRPM